MLLSACILIFQFSLLSVRWDPSCQLRAVGLGVSADELVFYCPGAGTVVRLLSGQILLALLMYCRAPCAGSWSPGARRALRRQQPSGLSFAPWGACCRAGSREQGKRIARGQVDEQALVCVCLVSWSVAIPELFGYEMVLVSKTVAVVSSTSPLKNACEELEILSLLTQK